MGQNEIRRQLGMQNLNKIHKNPPNGLGDEICG
jgi:hypothetical protein